MTLRYLPSPSARVIMLSALALVIAAGATLTGRGSQPTAANPIYGSVKLNPTSKFILEGHQFNVATWMTTCTYNTPGVPNNYYCQLGAYDVNMNYDPAKVEVVTATGTSTGGNTTTTLRDTTATWKNNAWAGSRVTLTGGTSAGQDRVITYNTKTTLTLEKPWDSFPAVLPDNTTTYLIGGMTNGSFLGSNNGILPIIPNSGRPVSCPVGPAYGVGWAELHCITLGDPSVKGAYGNGGVGTPSGSLTNLTLRGIGRGVMYITFTLPPAVNGTRVVKVDSLDIPVDIFQTGTRRVVLCPDANGNGLINTTDQLMMAQALNKKGPLYGPSPAYPEYPDPQPGYTVQKDPTEDGIINTADMLVAGGVFNQKCIQPSQD